MPRHILSTAFTTVRLCTVA